MYQYRINHKPRRKKYDNIIDYDRDTIKTNNGCLEWRWASNEKDYAKIRIFGKTLRVTRLLLMFYQQLKPEQQVLHNCFNSKCVNIEHLRVGTNQENRRDKDIAKVTELDVKIIKKMRYEYGMKVRNIAKIYQLSESHTSRITRGLYW